MKNQLQACLYNLDPTQSEELASQISAINFVRFVGEASTPDVLLQLVDAGSINLVCFHMDPDPAPILRLIDTLAEAHPDLATLAFGHDTDPNAIIAPIRAGCDQFVCEPIDHADLTAAIHRVATKRLLSRAKSRCVCIVGASGGAGATTLSCSLALEIAKLSTRETALVDLDRQFGDVATFFDCDPNYTMFDLAQSDGVVDRRVLLDVLTQLPGDLALLARPKSWEHAQFVTADMIQHTLDLLLTTHENIVVDLPRHLDAPVFAALGRADIVLIVCQLLVPSIRNAHRYQEALLEAGIPTDRLEIVVNRADSGGGRITIKDVEELTKKQVFATVPNDYQFVARSLDYGRPIPSQDESNPVRKAMRSIANKVVNGGGSDEGQKRPSRGLLRRFLSC